MREKKKIILRRLLTFALAFVFVSGTFQAVHANMAAPAEADIGSAITFEKNDAIAVTSEVLDIAVKGANAEITANYSMKNTTDSAVSTSAMFLSPNVACGGTMVMIKDAEIPFTVESYVLSYDTQVQTRDWRYAVLSSADEADVDDIDDAEDVEDVDDVDAEEEKTVDSISFTMDFAPQEEYDVTVSYTYRLGGYPDYDFDAKRGELEYYLTPAAMWKEFDSLTINLYLDKDMPVLTGSNLPFEKVEKQVYRYVSNTLPEENLWVTIDENWIQNISSTLRSPYFRMTIRMITPVILVVFAICVVIGVGIHRAKKDEGEE